MRVSFQRAVLCASLLWASPGHADVLGRIVAAVESTAAALLSDRLSPTGADRIGHPTVVDGDTLEIEGTRIRLLGVDAPETDQPCTLPGAVAWNCGHDAALALAARIGQRSIRCRPYDTDRYGRDLAVCYLAAEDLNRWMVANGWALAYEQYSLKYMTDQEVARRARRSLWVSTFDLPWVWRRMATER